VLWQSWEILTLKPFRWAVKPGGENLDRNHKSIRNHLSRRMARNLGGDMDGIMKHIVVDYTAQPPAFLCEKCGTRVEIKLPQSVENFVKMGRAFGREHAHNDNDRCDYGYVIKDCALDCKTECPFRNQEE